MTMLLEGLDLDRNSIGKKGTKELAAALVQNTYLWQLRLYDNDLDDEGVQRLIHCTCRGEQSQTYVALLEQKQ